MRDEGPDGMSVGQLCDGGQERFDVHLVFGMDHVPQESLQSDKLKQEMNQLQSAIEKMGEEKHQLEVLCGKTKDDLASKANHVSELQSQLDSEKQLTMQMRHSISELKAQGLDEVCAWVQYTESARTHIGSTCCRQNALVDPRLMCLTRVDVTHSHATPHTSGRLN